MNNVISNLEVKNRKVFVRKLIVRSTEIWGSNRHNRRQWLRKSLYLYDKNIHLLSSVNSLYSY